MRNLVVVVLFAFVVLGCTDNISIIVNNNSSQVVAYTLVTGHRTESYIVEQGEEKIHSFLQTFSYKMENYSSSPLQNSVNLVHSDNNYSFYDIDPFQANIYNTLSKDVVLQGNGAISTDPLIVNAGQEITTETILSLSPEFSAKTIDGYPVQVDYSYSETNFNIVLR